MNATALTMLADGGWVPVVFFFFFVVIWIMGAIGSAVKKQQEEEKRKRVRDSIGSPDWSDPSSVPPRTLPRGAQNRSGQNPQRSPMPAQRKQTRPPQQGQTIGRSGSSRPNQSSRSPVPPLPPLPKASTRPSARLEASTSAQTPAGARATQANVVSSAHAPAPETTRPNSAARTDELIRNVRLMLKNDHAKEALVLSEILGKPLAER